MGELFCFLDREKRTGRLHNFELESRVYLDDEHKRILVDIMLEFDNKPASWVELKHWIGHYNNQQFAPYQYFMVDNDSCIKSDVEKLLTIPSSGDKFMLIAFTPNPDCQPWADGITRFNAEFSPLSLHSLTNPDDYPKYFFLGLLEVAAKTKEEKQ